MFKTIVPYPAFETEVGVLSRHNEGFSSIRIEEAGVQAVLDPETLLSLRKTVSAVEASRQMLEYIARLVRRTRENRSLVLGASPRASICLLAGAKAQAALAGRAFIIPDDVKSLAAPVLRHRLILRPEAEIEGATADRVVDATLAEVEVPRE